MNARNMNSEWSEKSDEWNHNQRNQSVRHNGMRLLVCFFYYLIASVSVFLLQMKWLYQSNGSQPATNAS